MTLYQKYLFLREEILKHKWIESEKNKKDIGFENALVDWVGKHKKECVIKNLVDNSGSAARITP